ncbi:MAG: phosphatidylglycerol lysyltransferase domain-containing protein [Acidobacteriota bacterium]
MKNPTPHPSSSSVGLLGPPPLETSLPRLPVEPGARDRELDRVGEVVARHADPRAALAFLGDKRFLFSRSGMSFVMYRDAKRCRVMMGGPIGPGVEHAEILAASCHGARRDGRAPVIYQAGDALAEPCRGLGLRLTKIGEEAIVKLADFSLTGSHRRRLRQKIRRIEREGATFEVLPRWELAERLPELRRVSDDWLRGKRTREKSFSLGCFDPSYLSHFPMAVVWLDDEPIAFTNLWMGADGDLAIDLMRYSSRAPYGVMEYTCAQLCLWAQEQGHRSLSLGVAPLSGLTEGPRSPWTLTAGAIYRHGERFYGFRGLREYKEKFATEWQARYVAAPVRRLPQALLATCSLVSGGLGGLFRR